MNEERKINIRKSQQCKVQGNDYRFFLMRMMHFTNGHYYLMKVKYITPIMEANRRVIVCGL